MTANSTAHITIPANPPATSDGAEAHLFGELRELMQACGTQTNKHELAITLITACMYKKQHNKISE